MYARGRRQLTPQRLEQLTDKPFRCPVGETDPPARTADPRHLGCGSRLVGREHHAERGDDRVEACVLEGQRFSIGHLERDVQPLRARPLGAAFEQRRHVVGRGHLATAARGRERGVAVPGCHVEHVFIPAKVARLGQRFADDLQGGADHRVVSAGPRRLLAAFESSEIDWCIHGFIAPCSFDVSTPRPDS